MKGKDSWWWKIEPIASMVRINCRQAVRPSSYIAVDEIMVPFRGKSTHKVKIKGKPIPEGFKIWGQGYDGYVDNWLFHSIKEGSEGIGKGKNLVVDLPVPLLPADLVPTFQVPYLLIQALRKRHPERQFLVILDNLFLNVETAHALMAINVAALGTTRKNAKGIPKPLLDAKNAGQSLVWNSMIAIQVGWALTFVWQDNNAVLGTTTAFSVDKVEDRVQRLRRRPKSSSTNTNIIRPVFGDQSRKLLFIPRAIDVYNHGMNSIDTANQLRKLFTCHRS